MAKRFTDKEKWKNKSYRKKPTELKVAFEYILDNCDHAGIWQVDFELLNFQANINITCDAVLEHFGKHINCYKDDKWFISSYVDFNYGELSSASRVHKSVIKILQKERLWIDYTKTFESLKNKNKNKDKAKYKDKGLNSAEHQEISMSPFYQYVKKFLKSNKYLSPRIFRNLPLICRAFEDEETFKTWVVSIDTSKKFSSLETQTDKARYFTVALIREAGIDE